MSTKENFKDFLKRNTYLSKSVNSGKTTYQKLFETYDIYGEDSEVWKQFRTEEKDGKVNSSVKSVLSNLKNIDIDKLEENISSLEKTLGFLEEIVLSRNEKKESKKLLIFYQLGIKKWQAIHIAPLQPSCPCCVPTRGDWTGAGRVGLAGTNVRILSIIHRIFFAFCRSLPRFFSGKVVPLVKEKPEENRYESDTQRSGRFSRHRL